MDSLRDISAEVSEGEVVYAKVIGKDQEYGISLSLKGIEEEEKEQIRKIEADYIEPGVGDRSGNCKGPGAWNDRAA